MVLGVAAIVMMVLAIARYLVGSLIVTAQRVVFMTPAATDGCMHEQRASDQAGEDGTHSMVFRSDETIVESFRQSAADTTELWTFIADWPRLIVVRLYFPSFRGLGQSRCWPQLEPGQTCNCSRTRPFRQFSQAVCSVSFEL